MYGYIIIYEWRNASYRIILLKLVIDLYLFVLFNISGINVNLNRRLGDIYFNFLKKFCK